MKKIFISVGMTGRKDEEIAQDLNRAYEDLVENVLTDISEPVRLVDNFSCEKPEGSERLYCLGEAIKKLGDCDICYFCKGWQDYKGCIIERLICELYGIKIVEEA